MNTVFEHEQKIIPPVMIGAPALMEASSWFSVHEKVSWVLERLNPRPDFWIEWYRTGMERFGSHWGYVDLLTILYIATKWLRPKTYLEIGSAIGRSTCIVGAYAPNCEITAMDLWKASRMDIVENNLKSVGFEGAAHLIQGDSHKELPKLKGNQYELILVDGDHTKQGAILDLQATLAMLPRGGVIVFDDLCVGWLNDAWNEIVKSDGRFSTAEYRESGAGVAVGIKRR